MRRTKTCAIILFFGVPIFCFSQLNPTWIKIEPRMVFLESATKTDPMVLFNEQSEGKIPESPSKGLQKTDVSPLFWPYACIVDFKQETDLHEIRYFDGFSRDKTKVSVIHNGRAVSNVDLELNGNKCWKKVRINQKVRYVRIEISDGLGPTEIMFFGKKPSSQQPLANSKRRQNSRPKLSEFLGINGFVDDPLPLLSTFRWVREYHDWKWNTSDKGFGTIDPDQFKKPLYAFQPSYPGWNFDTYYADLKERNSQVLVCFQNSSNWITPKPSYKPMVKHAHPALPSSYLRHAEALFQVAARYGTCTVAQPKLKLKPNQPLKSGLRSIVGIENWNEPDRWWENREAYFRPMEFAAMCSADYDGHQGLLGKNAGVKNADPQLPMVMGGITSLDTNYLKTMWLWAQWNRKGSVPFDVVNFHHYPAHQQHALGPEEDGLKAQFASMKAFCQKYFPNLPVWCTEMGYDSDQNSPRSPYLVPNEDSEMAQANQIIKSIFEAWASGIDKYFLYMLRNVEDGGSIPYQTSGLVSSKKNGFTAKPSFTWIQSLLKCWGEYVFKDDWSTLKTQVYHLEKNGKHVLVLYASQKKDKTGTIQLKLKFKHKPQNVQLYEVSKSGFVASKKNLSVQGTSLDIKVSVVPMCIEYQ